MSETAKHLMEGLYKTITLTINGKELPFKLRKLSVIEVSSKMSLINSIIAGNGTKLKDEDNADVVDCIAWAIVTACVDPCFSREEEEGKVPLATLPLEKTPELAAEIFKHCGLIEGMQEAKTVSPFSEEANAEASSPPT